MSNEKPVSWIGASGAAYKYYVFDLEPDVPSRLGSYIYARKSADETWEPVYLGHGDLAVLCADQAVLQCMDARHPTHVHLRLNKRVEDREDERRDLLAHHQNAFAPDGCQPEADRPAPNLEVPVSGLPSDHSADPA